MTPLSEHIEAAAKMAGKPRAVVLGPCRQKELTRARWLAWRAAYDEGHTVSEIGRAFNRDHTTVIHGLEQVGYQRRPKWGWR